MGTLVIKVTGPSEPAMTSTEATLTSYLASEATKNYDIDSGITRIGTFTFHSTCRPKSIGPLPSCLYLQKTGKVAAMNYEPSLDVWS